MDITFTIAMTEQQIPQLIGLLGKMWANPDPAQQIAIVKVQQEAPAIDKPIEDASQIVAAAPAVAPAIAPIIAPAKPVSAAQVQQAAGAFIDADPANMAVLQGILAELGAKALPQLNPAQLEVFAAKLREQGVAL